MVEFEEVELDIILPSNGIGIVFMQPFAEICDYEPYHWQSDKKNKQIERIIGTLEIAKQTNHGCEKTHFTIFPEYTIPGLEGVEKIEEVLRSNMWNNGTVVIGGLDGLVKDEYHIICSRSDTEVHPINRIARVRDDQWINCCITWVKNSDGLLNRWVQAKLLPATQEELCPASHMFEGRAVYIFKPKISLQDTLIPFRFLTFICKDWIGSIGSLNAVDSVLRKIEEQRSRFGERVDISLTLVIERNDQPSHNIFLQRTHQYINEVTFPGVRRSEGSILFVNNAGRDNPGKCDKFGFSGFIFHPNCSFMSHNQYCPPSYTLKARSELINCKEARFRENGSCIISLRFLPPILPIVRRVPQTARIPLNPAIIHPIEIPGEGVEEDPRVPGFEVPASIKWVNDCLDKILHLLEHEREHPLRNEIEHAHGCICQDIRKQNDKFMCSFIELASCGIDNEKDKWIEAGERKMSNIDNWDGKEQLSLETVVHTSSIIKSCMPLDVKESFAHGTIIIQDNVIDILVVSGKTHEECFKYSKIRYPGSDQRSVIVVTRDLHDTSWDKKFKSILEHSESNSRREPNITNPESRFFHCGHQNLIGSCFSSRNLSELSTKVEENIGI